MPIFNHGLPIKANVIQGEGGTDTSKDTVTPDAMREGFTAHDAAGQPITGTIPNYDGAITEGAFEGAQAKYEEGVADGKQAEYDAFWDALQLNGQRREYSNFGAGVYVPSEIWLNPKYPFVLKGSAQNFMRDFNTSVSASYGGPGGHRAPVDLSGWKIDTSEVADAQYLFCNASVKNLTLDLSNATSLLMVFNGGNRGLSNNITLKVSEKCTSYSNAFYHNKNENWCTDVVRFAEGSVIAAGNLNLSHCNQSKVSLASVINALSSATTGLTVTLRLDAVKKAFETAEGANDGNTSDEWTALAATKPNWTINLINS